MEELGNWREGASLYMMWYITECHCGSYNDEMWTGFYKYLTVE